MNLLDMRPIVRTPQQQGVFDWTPDQLDCLDFLQDRLPNTCRTVFGDEAVCLME